MIDVSMMVRLIWDNWRIICSVCDRDGVLVLDDMVCPESEKVLTEELVVSMWEQAEQKMQPSIFTEPGSPIFYWIFSRENWLFVLGPLHSEPLSFTQEKAFLHERKIRSRDFSFKELTVAESLPVVALVYFMVSGGKNVEWLETEYDEVLQRGQKQLGYELLESRAANSREQRSHLSYQFERTWYQAIIEGKTLFVPSGDATALLDRVGRLAKGDTFKQIEYTVVAEVTLATRAAIDGGVSPDKAYEMSEVFLQKCAQCRETTEFFEISLKSIDSFARAVREAKKQEIQDQDVEKCKNYIAFHLTEKITVSGMAKELQISYSYLAAKFLKETGINIKKYIQQEKLSAAANQLKYSEASVGEIADYFSFPSASSMCTCFKEVYGMSPTEYRKTYKVLDFNSPKA